MWTTLRIRQFIFNLPEEVIFSTRDLLNFGTRAAVDQCLCRLVKRGDIRRLAWGLFMRNDFQVPLPSAFVVATEKAKAFGRQILTDGAEAAKLLGLMATCNQQIAYATNGRSSSFKYDDVRIYFRGVSARKVSLGDSPVGLAIRAAWNVGKEVCQFKDIEKAITNLNLPEHQQFEQSRHLMPFWMTNLLKRCV
jgi:Family of unknown function (DUF6088)